MTTLLDRLDDKVSTATARWDGLELFGYTCVFLGGLSLQAAITGAICVYFWGDLL